MTTILAGTGHREGKYDSQFEQRLEKAFLDSKPAAYIQGLASGFDLVSASIAIDLGIPVVSAKPWTTHTPRVSDRSLYEYVVKYSEETFVVTESDHYPGPWVYQVRNVWMVDEANLIVAYWNGKPGGTANCIKYANKQDKKVRNIYE